MVHDKLMPIICNSLDLEALKQLIEQTTFVAIRLTVRFGQFVDQGID